MDGWSALNQDKHPRQTSDLEGGPPSQSVGSCLLTYIHIYIGVPGIFKTQRDLYWDTLHRHDGSY